MPEISPETQRFNWYRIIVSADLASFVVRAINEDFAYLRLLEFDKSQPRLKFDLDASFDKLTEITRLDEKEIKDYRVIGQNWPEDNLEDPSAPLGRYVLMESFAIYQPIPVKEYSSPNVDCPPTLF